VPDSVTNAMVRDRLAEDDARGGFLLDGYPRTVNQVHELDEILAGSGDRLDAVLELGVDVDAVVQRLLRRAEIEGRADDTEEVIRNRMNVYDDQTSPLTSIYAERGVLVKVDGMGEVDEVAERIYAALDAAVAR
jgi:adenylate kinase